MLGRFVSICAAHTHTTSRAGRTVPGLLVQRCNVIAEEIINLKASASGLLRCGAGVQHAADARPLAGLLIAGRCDMRLDMVGEPGTAYRNELVEVHVQKKLLKESRILRFHLNFNLRAVRATSEQDAQRCDC
jgi:hypothetical protein